MSHLLVYLVGVGTGFGICALFAVAAYNHGLEDGSALERQSQRERVREVER